MDTYLQYDHTITKEQMENAMRHGYSVIVIINGEYYGYKPDTAISAAEERSETELF